MKDGIIDADKEKKIDEVINEDDVIDIDEVDYLLEQNKVVSRVKSVFFVKVITSSILDEEQSNDEVDDDKVKHLEL